MAKTTVIRLTHVVALSLGLQSNFYVSGESGECQRTRDKGNFHKRREKKSSISMAQKKAITKKSGKLFQWHQVYNAVETFYFPVQQSECQHTQKKLFYVQRQCDAPSVWEACTNEKARENVEHTTVAMAATRQHICDIIIGARKMRSKKSMYTYGRRWLCSVHTRKRMQKVQHTNRNGRKKRRQEATEM